VKIVEQWTIEFDKEKNLFSVDFGGKLSINWTMANAENDR